MFPRALLAIATFSLLTASAAVPSFAGQVGTVKPIGSSFTLSHNPPDRRVQIGKAEVEDIKLQSGMSRNASEARNHGGCGDPPCAMGNRNSKQGWTSK